MKKLSLILSSTGDVTSDYLCERLADAKLAVHRLDTDRIAQHATLRCDSIRSEFTDENGAVVSPADVATLILRRPKPIETCLEGDEYQKRHASGEWAEALEGFLAQIPAERWINHPSNNFRASHKIEQLRRASRAGLKVPAWIVTNRSETARHFFSTCSRGMIAKPLASGYIEREDPADDTVIFTSEVTEYQLDSLGNIDKCPVLFQEKVQKQSDVRLVVVGDSMVAVELHAIDRGGQQRLDIRRNAMSDVDYVSADIPETIRGSVQRLMKEYGLVFAAFDFAIDRDGTWIFFEINPNGQWAWLDLEAHTAIHSMFASTIGKWHD